MAKHNLNPKQLTDEMIKVFQQSTHDIFPVTRPAAFYEFEKGLYGNLIVKPIKRVARLLAADRELLVLFSSFTDQQPRTIEAAINLIEQADARLERTLAIIIHADIEGNFKLKNWGRENGITVIPIHIHGRFPEGEELERLVFQEFFSHDPFDVSGPVSDDTNFYGRRTEAQDIARQLQTGQVRACLGIRKIGKTSIINRVLNVAHKSHSCHRVMLDCSKDGIWKMSAGQLLTGIANAVETALLSPTQYADVQSVSSQADITVGHDALVNTLRRSTLPVLLFVDEVDYITPGSPTSQNWRADFNPFWRNLRAVYQEMARSNIRFSILVSGISSKWFREESIEGVENAALAFIPEEYLSPLQSGASVAMIKTIARTSGLQFERETGEHVAEVCSNIPFWIRKACSFIHRNIDIEVRPYTVTLEETTSLLDLFIETEGAALSEVALSHLFRVYPELADVAVAVFTETDDNFSPLYATVLEKYGVIAQRNRKKAVSGRMMREGIRLFLEKKRSNQSAPSGNLAFDSLDEWADELALLNAQRNKLEKRLRSIALNFIRFDTLNRNRGGGLLDRIAMVLPDNRRSKLKHLSADELMEKLTWSDLVRLIEKEWSLFSTIFCDRTQFSQNCGVINDRFDAHAKDADKADIALYRRALSWVETSLARSS